MKSLFKNLRAIAPERNSRGLLASSLALSICVFGYWVQPAQAEGSRSLYPSTATGSRANTEWSTSVYGPTTASTGNNSLARRTLLKVYAKKDEYILLGSSAVGSSGTPSNGNILVYNPGKVTGRVGAETIPGTADFSCNAQRTSTGNTNQGKITSRNQELAGPTSITGGNNAAGYVPCYYQATSTGVYDVVFYGPSGNGVASTGTPTGDISLASTSNFDNNQGATIAAWDVTVRSSTTTSTTDINGRLFTYYLSLFTGGNTRPINPSIYPVTTDGYQYRTDMNGLDPNGFLVYGNQQGFLNSDGKPLYHDVLGDSAQLTNLQGGTNFSLPTFPIFFTQADTTVLTALGIPISPIIPVVTNPTFAGTHSANNSNYSSGGTFNFTSNVAGKYDLIISRDGSNFDPTAAQNRYVTGTMTATGSQSVSWDGKDNSGNYFPVGTNYQVRVVVYGGEYHFPIIDAEASSGGPKFNLLNATNSLGNSVGFYDDRGYTTAGGTNVGTPGTILCAGSGSTPNPAFANPSTGFDTGGTQRAFGPANNANTNCGGSFGDAKGLDIWTYFPSSVQTTNFNIVAPDLTITKTHSGNFIQGQTGATYTLTATNSGGAATSGTVTVTDTLPTGLTYKTASGTGWTCSASGQTVTCTRSDVLAIASSYPAITLTVDVAANAASPITNIANVSGGGEIKTDNNSASDSTTIDAAPANTSSCPVQYQEIYSGGSGNSSIYAIHVDSGAAAALTNQALTATPNSLATDHSNRLVYYAAGTSLYAWDVINNTHITITSNISSFASGIKDLTGGGAAFYNGSLYLGVDDPNNSNGNNPRVEIYKVNFVSGSNGRTIQSVTSIGLSSYLGVNANWGDFIISNSGVIFGSTGNNTGGLWKFDLNTNTFTTLNSTFPASQLAKSSDGRLWAIGPSSSTSQTIQQLDPATGALTGTAKATTASADGAECVRGISTIGDRVWNDLNGNGTQDTGEPGIANVTVALYRDINGNGTIDAGDPLLATQTTDANGNYDFIDLVLGTYIVKVTDANNVLTQKSLTGGTNPKAVTLGSQQDFNNADFGYKTPPNLLLVKRITAINGNRTQNPNDGTLLNTFVNDPLTADDDSNWADRNTYLIGAFNGGKVKPGDEVEYSIYFLNTRGTANNVTLCDRIPDNMTLVPTGYNAASPHPTESGAIPSDTGIGFALDANALPTNPTVYLTNVNDSDRGRYYPPLDPNTPSTCKVLDAQGNATASGTAANTNGAVVVDVVKGTGTANQLPPATAPGTPTNSYGFIRFKAKVK